MGFRRVENLRGRGKPALFDDREEILQSFQFGQYRPLLLSIAPCCFQLLSYSNSKLLFTRLIFFWQQHIVRI
jgi:hypothetical protein